jgi:hypothetical protein
MEFKYFSMISNENLRKDCYQFVVQNLIKSQGEDDGAIVRELPVSETVSDLTTVIYEVKVLTGDRRGAGTEAPVSVVLYGEKGNSGRPKILQNSGNNFERGNFLKVLTPFYATSTHKFNNCMGNRCVLSRKSRPGSYDQNSNWARWCWIRQ